MKKTKKLISSTVVIALLLILCAVSFSSCLFLPPDYPSSDELLGMEEKERAEALIKSCSTKLNYLNSLTSVNRSKIKYADRTVSTEATTKATGLIRGDLSMSTVYVTLSPGATGAGAELIGWEEGYQDGKYYIVPENSDAFLWSEETLEAFIAKRSENSSDFDMFACYEGAKSVSAVQNADKTWTATYTDFNAEWLSNFESIIGELNRLYSTTATLTDITVILNVNEELYPTFYDIEYTFTPKVGQASAPAIEIGVSMAYSDFNTTVNEKKSFTEETRVESLFENEKLIEIFDEIAETKNGKILSEIRASLVMDNEEMEQTGTETLVFSNDNGKFAYNIISSIDGTVEQDKSYADGKITVFGNQVGVSNDEDERATLALFINQGQLSINNYKSYTKTTADGVTTHTFTLANPDTSLYGYGIVWINKSATVTVTTNENGDVTSYEYYLYLARADVTVTQTVKTTIELIP